MGQGCVEEVFGALKMAKREKNKISQKKFAQVLHYVKKYGKIDL